MLWGRLRVYRSLNSQTPAARGSVAQLDLPVVEAIAVAGNYAYLATADGLQLLDVSDPIHPIVVNLLTEPRWVQAVTVASDYAYVTASNGELTIIDITQPAHPTRIGSIALPGYLGDVRVAGNTAYVATGRVGCTR